MKLTIPNINAKINELTELESHTEKVVSEKLNGEYLKQVQSLLPHGVVTRLNFEIWACGDYELVMFQGKRKYAVHYTNTRNGEISLRFCGVLGVLGDQDKFNVVIDQLTEITVKILNDLGPLYEIISSCTVELRKLTVLKYSLEIG